MASAFASTGAEKGTGSSNKPEASVTREPAGSSVAFPDTRASATRWTSATWRYLSKITDERQA